MGADLVFLYGESVPACTHHIDKQYAGYNTLQYMTGGAVELWIGFKRHLLEGQAIWSAYPGPRIRFHAATGYRVWEHRYIAFQGALVRRWEREGLFPVPPNQLRGNTDFRSRFDELLSISRHTDARAVRQGIHQLEGILLDLADVGERAGEPAPWLARATQALSAGAADEPPDYAALAESLGISESTFRRGFRQGTGTSPHAFLLQRRAAEARRMLGETDLPLKTIAGRLGYRDVYFFSRQFRQLVGVPPATYRRSRQQ